MTGTIIMDIKKDTIIIFIGTFHRTLSGRARYYSLNMTWNSGSIIFNTIQAISLVDERKVAWYCTSRDQSNHSHRVEICGTLVSRELFKNKLIFCFTIFTIFLKVDKYHQVACDYYWILLSFLPASHVVPRSRHVTMLFFLGHSLKLAPQLAGNGLHLQPCCFKSVFFRYCTCIFGCICCVCMSKPTFTSFRRRRRTRNYYYGDWCGFFFLGVIFSVFFTCLKLKGHFCNFCLINFHNFYVHTQKNEKWVKFWATFLGWTKVIHYITE